MEKKWLTVQEAADHVGVARATIYKWAKQGRLPIYKLGERVARISVEDLEKLVMQAKPLYANGHADKAARVTILQKTKGAWADNPLIDQALAELNRGWNEWAEKSF
ncbi:MAG: helix-turn-helix domain-containing protein [Thermoanaerobacter sp.]|nr:helix-turn-helix domain-containing protein [Thermoanaerobacter sp.]